MTIRKTTLSAVICLLVLSAVSIAEPDINRFDPLLKSNWYGVYLQGMKLGYAEMTLEKIESPVAGWRQSMDMTAVMKAAGQEIKMTSSEERIFKAPFGELYSIKTSTASPSGDMMVTGYIEGDSFVVKAQIGGQESVTKFTSPVDYLDSSLVGEMRILSGKAVVGDSIINGSFQASPPLLGKVTQVIRFKNKEDRVFNGLPESIYSTEVLIKEANFTMPCKIDSYGNYIEIGFGGVMTFKLEDEDIAKRSDLVMDIMLDNLVSIDKKIENASAIKKLILEISGIDSSGLLATSMQKIKPDKDGFEVTISAQKTPSDALNRPIADEAEYLKSEMLIQSDDPKIIALADSIVGLEKNSWEAARKINTWVFTNIEKKFTPDLSNALQTLNSRFGDCGEHTALAVALLRAAGIPARPIVGLIYWEPGSGFGYHAWVEAYVGQWVQMDPTWNQELATPTHLSLARGDILSQASVLVNVIGKVKIAVVEAK
jgi:hypothetical protein